MMKRLSILATACSVLLFCSCEHLYTADELQVIVEWNYGGWSQVFNETDGTVTMVSSFRPIIEAPYDTIKIISEIRRGEAAMHRIGSYIRGESIHESLSATIRLSDGSEFVCTNCGGNPYMDPWSEYFYKNNVQTRKGYEVVDHSGKNLRHDIVIETYHIDDNLVDLWRSSQQ